VLGAVALAGFFYLRSAEKAAAPVPGTNLTREELQTVYSDLCRVQTLARADLGEARDLFYGRVHSPLHEIARATGEVDRTVAARLLEAKNDMEAAFSPGGSQSQAAGAVGRLLPQTEQALRSVEVTTSSCRSSLKR
jgi:hypothetical protein